MIYKIIQKNLKRHISLEHADFSATIFHDRCDRTFKNVIEHLKIVIEDLKVKKLNQSINRLHLKI